MAWTVEVLNAQVVAELEALPADMRMTGRDGISCALYVTATRKRVVVVRVFVKKTRTTPGREIRLALQRAKEVQP